MFLFGAVDAQTRLGAGSRAGREGLTEDYYTYQDPEWSAHGFPDNQRENSDEKSGEGAQAGGDKAP